MPTIALTDLFIKAITPTGERQEIADATRRGLVLRVAPDGERLTWTFSYRRKSDGLRQRLTLGIYPDLKLADARAAALRHAVAVSEGRDPAAERRRPAGLRLNDLVAEWAARRAPAIRSAALTLTRMRAHILPRFGKEAVADLKRGDVALHLEKLARMDKNTGKTRRGGPAGARRTADDLLLVLGWGVKVGLLDANPLAGLAKPGAPSARDRVLTEGELRNLLAALPRAKMDDATRRAIRLLALLACRVGELIGADVRDVDTEQATLTVPAHRSKNGRPAVIPLSLPALALIREQLAAEAEAEARRAKRERRRPAPVLYLFPNARTGAPVEPHSVSVAVRRNLEILGAGQWTPHDLRRTAATMMADLGVQPHIIEVTLNHISGFRAGVAGIYNRNTYAREHRDALERLAARIAEIEDGGERKIVPLRA
jgi:integrase